MTASGMAVEGWSKIYCFCWWKIINWMAWATGHSGTASEKCPWERGARMCLIFVFYPRPTVLAKSEDDPTAEVQY